MTPITKREHAQERGVLVADAALAAEQHRRAHERLALEVAEQASAVRLPESIMRALDDVRRTHRALTTMRGKLAAHEAEHGT